jgi:hypothetical protein
MQDQPEALRLRVAFEPSREFFGLDKKTGCLVK